MTIEIGNTIPETTVRILTNDGPKAITTTELLANKRVVLFGVPGAFTPTCHKNHLPGYVLKADDLRAKKIDDIMVVSVNDQFVMKAWKDATDTDNKVTFLADGNGELASAMQIELDGTGNGMGKRFKRFSMLVENGVVKSINVEPSPGQAELTGAEAMLASL